MIYVVIRSNGNEFKTKAERSFDLDFVFETNLLIPELVKIEAKRTLLILHLRKSESFFFTNSKDRSRANSVYSTNWTDRSEAKSVYSTNSKERSGAKSVYSTNSKNWSEAKSVYFTNSKNRNEAKSVYTTISKNRSVANSAYSRNRQDRSEKTNWIEVKKRTGSKSNELRRYF